MDIRLFIQALGRHKLIAVLGVMVALFLAVFSHVRIDPFGEGPMFTYRKNVIWGSRVVLQITQPGFYEGRVIKDVGRRSTLLELAPLYAELANSDPVRARMRKGGPIYGAIFSQAIVESNGSGLPLIELVATSREIKRASERASRQASAFIAYLRAQQERNQVPENQRLSLDVIKGPSAPVLAVPRKKTLPLVVFMSMLVVTGALILVVDNLGRRRTRAVDAADPGTELPRMIPRAEPPAEPEVPVTAAPRRKRATLGE